MKTKLIIPMMMFGKFRSTVAARDAEGKTIIEGHYASGKPKYKKKKVWITHDHKLGDKGVYPSVNHIYERMAKGRQKLSQPAENLKERWANAARMWVEENNWQMTEKEKVVIEMVAYFPADKIRRDTNNVFKLLMDSFTDIIYDDDEYGLPRVMDFHRVAEGESPYFELNIYRKDEENK